MAIRFPSKGSNDPRRRAMAKWIDEQCQAYRDGMLSQEQIEKLESIPGWTWNLDSDFNDDELDDEAPSKRITGRD